MKRLIFIVPVLICCLSLIRCTNILDTKERELSVIDVPNKDYKLRVVYIPSNATIQSSIQIRKFQGRGTEELLQDYERYNYVDTLYLQNDTTFLIILRDTISYLGNKPDTMIIKLK
jgi:hypothetical protein